MAWNDGLITGSPAHQLASCDDEVIRTVAGPGSGKSFALKRRIARLLEEGVPPHKILAITFTRTAAQDLQKEIESLNAQGASEVHSRTLHSHALKILQTEQVLLSTQRCPRMVIDHEILPALTDIDVHDGIGIRGMKSMLQEYLAAWACLQSDEAGFVKSDEQSAFERNLVDWLKVHNGILVGEVIPIAIGYLRDNPMSPEIGNYSHILVDEYQDLNKSEQEFIRLIKGDAKLLIVGDDDQSIYGFKFANPEGIRDVEGMYGGCTDIYFDECRRCPIQVTQMASQLIAHNSNRTLGELHFHKENQQGDVEIIQWDNFDSEINGIVNLVKTELLKGVIEPQDVLILTPRRLMGYRLRYELVKEGIVAKSYFRESAIESPNARFAYSLLYCLADENDDISIRYLLGYGSNDYRRKQYGILKDEAQKKGISVAQLLEDIVSNKENISGVKNIVTRYTKLKEEINTFIKVACQNIETAIFDYFGKEIEDLTTLQELINLWDYAIKQIGFESVNVENFGEWYKKVFRIIQENITQPELPENFDHVRIMSLHASKGLSAKFVILCSMIDELMPYIPNKLIDRAHLNKLVEEQRRLFYVAITRCKSSEGYQGKLIISSFLMIDKKTALKIGVSKPVLGNAIKVSNTRFIRDFGTYSPKPTKGM